MPVKHRWPKPNLSETAALAALKFRRLPESTNAAYAYRRDLAADAHHRATLWACVVKVGRNQWEAAIKVRANDQPPRDLPDMDEANPRMVGPLVVVLWWVAYRDGKSGLSA